MSFSKIHCQPLSSATAPAIAAMRRQIADRRRSPAYNATAPATTDTHVSSPAG